MSRKNIYLALALIIIVLVLLSASWQLGKSSINKACQAEISQKQEEIGFLQSALEPFYPPLPEKIYTLSGKVINIQDKTILMEALVRVSRFPKPGGAETKKQNIKVIVVDQTKITEFEIGMIPLPGEPSPEKILSFSDIKVGNNISVTSAENIKGKTEVVASQIRVIK